MNWLLKHKVATSLLAGMIHAVFIRPLSETLWFHPEALADLTKYQAILYFLSFISIVAITWFTLHFVEQIKNRNPFYLTWLKISGTIGILLLILLILIWPGYWQWDEMDVINASKSYTLFTWQSLYTQLQYILSIYIIPISAGITIIQILGIATILGYILTHVSKIISNKYLVFSLYGLLLLTPAFLLSYTHTLRAHIFTFLLILLLFEVFLLFYYGKNYVKNKHLTFIGLSFLIGILATWRSEGIIYTLLLPVIWFYLDFHKEIFKSWKKVGISTAISVIMIVSFFTATQLTNQPTYALTANLNTLSVMLHDDIQYDGLQEDLRKLDQAVSLAVLLQFPDNCNIPAYWSMYNGRANESFVRWDKFEAEYTEYLDGVKNIFLNNPLIFLKYKTELFAITNHMAQGTGDCNSLMLGRFTKEPDSHQFSDEFQTTILSKPLDEKLRTGIISSIIFADTQSLRFIFWNVTPVIAILVFVIISALIRRKYLWILLISPLLAHAALVFVSAPAAFFMYYFPVYAAGLFLTLLYVLLWINPTLGKRASKKSSLSAIIDPMKTPETKVLIAIPAYNCADQITRVLGDIDTKLQKRVAEVAVIDNGSTDDTVQRALDFKKTSKYKAKLHVYKNDDNYNLGGTHKVAFTKAEKEGFTHVIILHGDDQAKSSEANDLLDFAEAHPQQTVLGSRFNKESRLHGYDQKRIFGNKVLNAIYSTLTLRKLEDLGSGLNLFYLKDLDKKTYLKFADKLTFNYELILDLVKRKVNFAYLPITWSEEDQVSNARNVTIFKTALSNVLLWRIGKPAVNDVRKKYTCKEAK